MNTMTNHYPVTKAKPFSPLSTNLLFGPLTFEPNIPIWDRYKSSPYSNIFIFLFINIYDSIMIFNSLYKINISLVGIIYVFNVSN